MSRSISKRRIQERFEGIAPNMKDAKKRTKSQASIINEVEIPQSVVQLGKSKKYYIKTYGCQMNDHDTEVMSGILELLGYTKTIDFEEADIIMLNTCAIRENAENKVFGKIGSFKKLKLENPNKIIAVCGCMSQEEKVVDRLLAKHSFIDLIFGTHNIHRLPSLLEDVINSKLVVVEVWSKEGDIVEDLPRSRKSETKAWVNIIYGCDKFCTYCIVPFTRGKERSRTKEEILKEIGELKDQNYQEVTLLGQNVNSYGLDNEDDYTMSNLLEDIALMGIPRIRFTTSHPWDFSSEMVDVIAKYDNIMPHIHLPVQSGNNEILKIMGRSYTKEQYLRLFDEIKEKVKNVTVTTDIIVGYPNETKEQFQETLDLYNYCKYDTAFTFIYSPREGTPAAKIKDNVSLEDKKDRLEQLNVLVNKYAYQANEDLVGSIQKVLIDGPSQRDKNILAGYSEGMKLVHIKGDYSLCGKIVNVKITEAKSFNLYGELVKE